MPSSPPTEVKVLSFTVFMALIAVAASIVVGMWFVMKAYGKMSEVQGPRVQYLGHETLALNPTTAFKVNTLFTNKPANSVLTLVTSKTTKLTADANMQALVQVRIVNLKLKMLMEGKKDEKVGTGATALKHKRSDYFNLESVGEKAVRVTVGTVPSVNVYSDTCGLIWGGSDSTVGQTTSASDPTIQTQGSVDVLVNFIQVSIPVDNIQGVYVIGLDFSDFVTAATFKGWGNAVTSISHGLVDVCVMVGKKE